MSKRLKFTVIFQKERRVARHFKTSEKNLHKWRRGQLQQSCCAHFAWKVMRIIKIKIFILFLLFLHYCINVNRSEKLYALHRMLHVKSTFARRHVFLFFSKGINLKIFLRRISIPDCLTTVTHTCCCSTSELF